MIPQLFIFSKIQSPSAGFEPTITASKAVVISISLRGHQTIIRQIGRNAKDVIQLFNEKFN